MIANPQGPAVAGSQTASNATNNVQDPAFAQAFPSPANFLYSPLANHPAPLLTPVRQSIQQQTALGAGDQRQNQVVSSTMNGPAPMAQMQSSSVKQEGKADSAASILVAQATSAQQTRRQSDVQGIQAASQTRQGGSQASQPSQANPNSVEGLSFSDDFRDPFMGFLEVE